MTDTDTTHTPETETRSETEAESPSATEAETEAENLESSSSPSAPTAGLSLPPFCQRALSDPYVKDLRQKIAQFYSTSEKREKIRNDIDLVQALRNARKLSSLPNAEKSHQEAALAVLRANHDARADMLALWRPLYREHALLKHHIKELEAYLVTVYGLDYAKLKNEALRQAALSYVLRGAQHVLNENEVLLGEVDGVLRDIDRAVTVINAMTNALKTAEGV